MERNILFKETANGNGIAGYESDGYNEVYTGDAVKSRKPNGTAPYSHELALGAQPGVLPKKLDEDNRNGYTCFVEIDLKMTKNDRATAYKCIETKTIKDKDICTKRDWNTPVAWVNENGIAKMTAIFVPPDFNINAQADIIIYLHGHKLAYPGTTSSIKQYLEYPKPSYFNFREAIAKSGKNVIFVAPTLGPRSQYGNLVQNFDAFMEKVLASVREYIILRRGLKGSLKMGRLIIAAHSGGGKAMLAIAHSNQQYAKRVSEFWGFDSLYQGGGESKGSWIYFASQNPATKKIYAYYYDTTSTGSDIRKKAEKLDLDNVFAIPSSVKDHFKLLLHYFKERLDNVDPNHTAKEKEFEFSEERNFLDNEGEPDAAGFKLTKFTPLTTPIVVGKYYEREKVNGKMTKVLKATVKEAPAHFLPIIIKRAIGESGKDWFSNFTQIEFLGRKFKSGQFIHTELANTLRQIEKKLAEAYGGKNKDPKVAGDFLLNTYEGLSGSRGQSATATFSMHMFGLAIDVNYLRNPFIEAGDIQVVNAVLERAGLLIDGSQPKKYFHGMGYDEISKLDKLLEKYFALTDKPASLKERIDLAKEGSPWKKMNAQKALDTIKTDLTNLATKLARGNKKEVIQKGGILDLPKEFVTAMIDGGLSWGGFYGDMMHFDMRTIGAGKKIQQERIRYQHEKNAEAKLNYQKKITKSI